MSRHQPVARDDHTHHGLEHDLETLLKLRSRRRILRLAGAGGAMALGGGLAHAACSLIPQETGGPYPADGSNGNQSGGPGGPGGDPGGPGGPGGNPGGPGSGGGTSSNINVLTSSGIVRRDIRSSFGTSTTMAPGLPLALRIALVNTNASCARLSGYAVYIWHCDRDGNYSLYSTNIVNENYLRGVQITNSDGIVGFSSIFPACYSGRWPHIHVEVYRDANTATSFSNALRTTQIAMPAAICQNVYNNVAGYSQSIRNLSQVTLDTDNVFSDGYSTQLATIGGSSVTGLSATIQIGISI